VKALKRCAGVQREEQQVLIKDRIRVYSDTTRFKAICKIARFVEAAQNYGKLML
jgi:hypothetical protein